MFFKFSVKGTKNITRRVPDTITSWIITGFSLDSYYGLGLTQQSSKLTVFQPFFVTLNLPYSIKHGEVISIQCGVFNYLGSDQTVEVTLYNILKEFEFVNSANNVTTETQRSVKTQIANGDGASISFMIRALRVGYITIKLLATSAIAGDALENKLLVLPEGVTQYVNKAVLIDLRKSSMLKSNISIEIPPDAVPDSTKIEASAIGDILGPSIHNLDKLM